MEVFSLLGWLIALILAWQGARFGASFLHNSSSSETLRWLMAFVLIFVLTLLVLGLVRMSLKGLLTVAGMGLLDRLLGAGFGALRALILALVVVMTAGLTSLPRETWWRGSVFAPPLETAVIAGKHWLPEIIARRIRYR